MVTKKFGTLFFLLMLPSGIAFGQDAVIGPKGIGPVLLCSPLQDLQKRFPNTRNTLRSSEDQEWKAKIVSLESGQWLLAEASWMDSTRIWRLSTNSTRYATVNGVRVGDRVQSLADRHLDIDFNEGDGEYAFVLNSPAFSFGFTVEDLYAKAFYKVVDHQIGRKRPIEILNPAARITSITVAGDCAEATRDRRAD